MSVRTNGRQGSICRICRTKSVFYRIYAIVVTYVCITRATTRFPPARGGDGGQRCFVRNEFRPNGVRPTTGRGVKVASTQRNAAWITSALLSTNVCTQTCIYVHVYIPVCSTNVYTSCARIFNSMYGTRMCDDDVTAGGWTGRRRQRVASPVVTA